VLESGTPSRSVTARDTPSIASWSINPSPDIDFHASTVAGVLPGADACTPGDILSSHAWQVDAGSDRQGLRLKGPDIALSAPCTRPSEPVLPGTIQCPPDGQPIILLADAQTVGGYPRIGHVAQADLPRLAQLRPGETLCFHDIDVEEAIALHRAQQARLARIELAIQARLAR
jgi:allophanate hydrolase subunit 2